MVRRSVRIGIPYTPRPPRSQARGSRLRYDLRIYNEDSPMSALLWLIPLAIYIWVAHAGHHQKQTAMAYFWMAIIAIGVIGVIYTMITTGSIPAGCCGDE